MNDVGKATPQPAVPPGSHVFVTGGAGYIGSICVEQLIQSNCRVTVFDNLSEGHRAAVDERAQFVEGDLLDRAAVGEALTAARPDAVIHFAASALVAESMLDPGKYFRNNVTAGINLLDAMVAADVHRLVFSSSCATYGVPASVPIVESMRQSPINPYGASKLIFEQMVPWYEQAHGLRSVGLRFFNVAGASFTRGEAHRVETHLIPNILKVALGERDCVRLYGTDYDTPDGTCVRDFVHVLDIAAAHVASLRAVKSGVFNVGNGIGFSVAEVVACCRRITGHPIPVTNRPRRAGDPARLVADSSQIQAVLGWRPRHSSLDQIVSSAWAWHQTHRNGYDGEAVVLLDVSEA